MSAVISDGRLALSAPARTVEQRMEALRNANRIRSRRAELKRDLKARRVQLVPLLLDPPEWLLAAKVYELLLATPKIGRVKANKLLSIVRISPAKTIGGMSDRQRGELARLVGRR